MENMIEPNIHPLIVHFTVAFLITSTLAFLTIQFSPKDAAWRTSLKSAADWMFAFGVIAAVAAVAAGLQAYYSVAHDGPSHAAMTVHRNIAVPTAVIFVLLGLWRWKQRKSFPSLAFSLVVLLAAGALATTAWWGGRLVFHHGLGVESLPAVTGEGHDHEHGPGQAHGDESGETGSDDHDNSDGHHDDDAAEASNSIVEAGSPEAAVNAYGAALRSGDEAALHALLAPDVIIAEGGGAERSLEEYAGHHMPADMAFTAAVEFSLKKRDFIAGENLATVISESQIHGEYKGETIHSRMIETMVLKQENGRWRIAHIHWSSAPIKGEHAH